MAARKKGSGKSFPLHRERGGGGGPVNGATLENEKGSDSYKQGHLHFVFCALAVQFQ